MIGANSYYLFVAAPSDINADFAAANAIDAKVLRTWAFADGLNNDAYYKNVRCN